MIINVLCDADFFVALLIAEDSNHPKAIEILNNPNYSFWYSNLTKYELITVLSRKLPQNLAIQALEIFENTFDQEIIFDTEFESEIVKYFKNSTNKNQSFFDIACLIQAQILDFKIASFDKFYPVDIIVS